MFHSYNMNSLQKTYYIAPGLELVNIESQGFIAASSLENPGYGDEWGWN